MAPVFCRTAVAAFSFIVIHRVLSDRTKRRRKPRWWMKKLFKNRLQYGNRLLQDMANEAVEDTVKNFTRMTLVDFEYLVALISHKVEKIDTHMRQAITVKERLALTLRFLATGDSFTSLQYLFRVSKQSISTIVPDVCNAIIESLAEYVKVSQNK